MESRFLAGGIAYRFNNRQLVVLGFSGALAQSVLSTAPRDDLEQIHAAPFSAHERVRAVPDHMATAPERGEARRSYRQR